MFHLQPVQYIYRKYFTRETDTSSSKSETDKKVEPLAQATTPRRQATPYLPRISLQAGAAITPIRRPSGLASRIEALLPTISSPAYSASPSSPVTPLLAVNLPKDPNASPLKNFIAKNSTLEGTTYPKSTLETLYKENDLYLTLLETQFRSTLTEAFLNSITIIKKEQEVDFLEKNPIYDRKMSKFRILTYYILPLENYIQRFFTYAGMNTLHLTTTLYLLTRIATTFSLKEPTFLEKDLFYLLGIAIPLAQKAVDDSIYNNQYQARVASMDLKVFNRLEGYLCDLLDFKILEGFDPAQKTFPIMTQSLQEIITQAKKLTHPGEEA